MTEFSKNDIEFIKEEAAYQGFFQIKKLTFRHRLFKGGWSNPLTREIFFRGHAVGVLLYDPDKDKVVLIEQCRVAALDNPTGPWLYEIVAGIIDTDETVEQIAYRETKEEAGCEILDMMPMRFYYSSPGGSTETLQLFCGRVNSDGVGGIHGVKTENEDIRVHVMSREAAYELVENGKIVNAAAVIALQWLQLHVNAVRARWQ